jgi:glutathione S-transferase
MQLIGMLDSPFVRRVAITMQRLGIEYSHWPLSIFRTYDEFRTVNPLVKVPTLVLDDGEQLVESSLIINYIESLAGKSLMPAELDAQRKALQHIGVALIAAEKVAQRIYELKVRPKEYQYEPWLERINEQLVSALDQLEVSVAAVQDNNWLLGDTMTQADITVAVVWRFVVYAAPQIAAGRARPALEAFSKRAEALPEFLACPID